MKPKNFLPLPLLAIATLLCAPAAGFAQTILGSAGNFVLLGGTGVSGSAAGGSFSNGNVGAPTFPEITDFGPDTIVNGSTVSGPVVTSVALPDLAHAQTALFGLAGANPLGGLATVTLSPGVYTLNGAITVPVGSTITLNANHQNDVVWVFNFTGASGALTTDAGVTIKFINLGTNGGSDDGVFWNSNTAITIGDQNVVAGNYLAGTSITFPSGIDGASASGSALAQAAVTFGGAVATNLNVLGGPGGGNLAGGLALTTPTTAITSGYVLLSPTGTYSGGIATTLTPGTIFYTTGATVDGNSANATPTTTGSLTVFGTTATLTGNNTYTGGTIVDGGTLITGSANLPVNGSVTLTNSNGTVVVSGLIFNQTFPGTFGGAITGNGSVTLNTGALTLSGVNTYTGGTMISGGTLFITGSASLPGNVTNHSALTFDQAAATVSTYAGVISGTGTVTKQDGGTVNLTGANLYTGVTTVSSGILNIQNSAALGSPLSSTTVASGATLQVQGNIAPPEPLNLAGPGVGGLGVLDSLSGNNTVSGPVTLNGAATIDADAGTLTISGAVGGAAQNLTVGGAGNVTLTGGVGTTTGTLTKNGLGTLTLLGTASTFTGGTTVNAGTLALGAANMLAGTGALAVNGGTLDLGATSQTVGAVSLNGGALNNGTLTGTSFTSIGGTVGAVLAGVGSSFTNTSGTTTLNGVDTYTGGTTINAGTIVMGSASALGTGTTAVAAGATLNTGVFGFDLTRLSGAGTLIGSGVYSFAGANESLATVLTGAASLTKAGANTLTLSGLNTYTGGTTVSAGTLFISPGGLLGGAAGALAVSGGTLDLGATSQRVGAVSLNGGALNDGTLTGTSFTSTGGTVGAILAGAGSSFTNTSGTTTLSGVNTYTGGTTVSGGTLIASSTALPTAGSVTLSNNSVLVLNQALPGTFSGVVSGTGSLTVPGTSTLALTGTNSYTGGTTVSGGTLVASSAVLPAGGNVVLANNSALVFNQAAVGTFSGAITGVGTLTMEGAGPLTLTGASTVPLNLLAGSLYLAGAGTIGTTTVASGAFLGGIGTINSNLINNGTVSPGDAPGTINVSGNYIQGPNGTLVIQFASAASYDKLVVTGTAALAGTMQLSLLNGFVPTGLSFPVLTAAGGVSGTFTPITGSAALAATVTYGATTVTVSFLQLPIVPVAAAGAAAAGVALTPNQTAVGFAAESAAPITVALDGVPLATQLPGALNALSPQGYEIWSTIAYAHATSLADKMERASNATPDHDNLYFDVSQAHGREGQDLDVGQSDFTTTSGLVGDDHVVGPNLTLGGFFAYSRTEADLGTPGSSTIVKDFTLGARANWTSGPWFVHGIAAYDFDDYDSTRPVDFPGTAATAGSHTRGGQWTVGVSGGQNIPIGAMTLSPFVGVLASGWRADGFTESGAGAFDNSLADQAAHSLRSQLGVELRSDLTAGSALLQPHVRLAWLHEFADAPRTMLVSFDGVGYGITTQKSQLDSAQVAVGLDVVLSPRAVIYSDLSVQTGDVTKILGEFQVGFSFRF
jgi:autotransporter-associated beta strand protein